MNSKEEALNALEIIKEYRDELDERNGFNQKMWATNTKNIPDYVKTDEEYDDWANKQEEEFRMIGEGIKRETKISNLLIELEELIEEE